MARDYFTAGNQYNFKSVTRKNFQCQYYPATNSPDKTPYSCYIKKCNPLAASFCWDTRTRTRNDRTRICSVTITPYPNFMSAIVLFPDCDCKGTHFFLTDNIFTDFFLKNLKIIRFFTRITINQCTFA